MLDAGAVAGEGRRSPTPTHRGRTTTMHARSQRVAVLDALRGAAAILMIAWHAADGWLADAHRAGGAWSALRVAGGLAMPLFSFTAGASLAIAASRGRSLGSALERAAWLASLAWLLELERWAIDRGAIADPRAWLTAGAALLALIATRGGHPRRSALALFATARRASSSSARAGARLARAVTRAMERRIARIALLVLPPCVSTTWLRGTEPAFAPRFDVLACIAGCVTVCAIAAALGEWAALRTRGAPSTHHRSARGDARGAERRSARSTSAALATASVALVLLAPIASSSWGLPAWIAATPAARWAPFPILPWCSYALAGMAAARFARHDVERRGAIVVAAIVLAAIAFEGGLPWTRRALAAWPIARPLARLVFAASVSALLACLLASARERALARVARAMGRASLALYVASVAISYGALAPFARSLAPLECALAVAALIGLCGALALHADALRDRALRAISSLAPSRRTSFRRPTSVHDTAFRSSAERASRTRLQAAVIRGLMRPARRHAPERAHAPETGRHPRSLS